MKIQEAIDYLDEVKPNQYPFEIKLQWLSELDARLYEDIIKTHEGDVPEVTFPYTDSQTELLAPFPHTCIYADWMRAKIDDANGETARYQNSMIMFNAEYEEFARWYNSTHMPIQLKRRVRA